MADIKHGAYGEVQANGISGAANNDSRSAFVYIGTAPVHQVEGGANNVNVPILCNNMADFQKYFGYSDDWAKYTVCEGAYVHMNIKGVGPLVVINVLDPNTHVKTTDVSESKTPSSGSFTISDANLVVMSTIVVGTKVLNTDYTLSVDEQTNVITVAEKTSGSLGTDALTVTYSKKTAYTSTLTPANGRVTIVSAEDIILDSVAVTGKTKGTDYTQSYDITRKVIEIVETSAGSLGTSALTITYQKVDPDKVTSSAVIGSTDGYGLNTGVYAIKNVYGMTGYIPAYLLAPGFSSVPAIHNAMYQNSIEINGHWRAWIFADIPIVDSESNPVTLATAPTWKTTNGYTNDNESVFFPLAKGTDGRKYHLSVLNAANFQELLIANDGIPYMTGSNTDCPIIENLYLGESDTNRVFDDELINRTLNANGINSAAYVGGRWAIWGCMAASYSPTNANNINTFDVCLMMLYYLTNDFQHRRSYDIDQPMTANDLRTIVSEEQSRLDALIGVGALIYGKASVNASPTALSDMYQGDFSIVFDITTTPLAKSLTAIAVWTSAGFVTYFASLAA